MATGWEITDGVTIIKSKDLGINGIYCVGEDNIDDRSFSNSYLYNPDSQGYYLSETVSDIVSFTLRFFITKPGRLAILSINQLKGFFDKPGQQFTIKRLVSDLSYTFVVDAISTTHYTVEGEWIPFELSGSFIGSVSNTAIIKRRIYFNGENPQFQFPHDFTIPEPSTVFGEAVQNDFVRDANVNFGDAQGIYIYIRISSPVDQIKLTNLSNDESFIINYSFISGDIITIDTSIDDIYFDLQRNTIHNDLITYIDYETSLLPMLYFGSNLLRFDLTLSGTPVYDSEIYIDYLYKS